jgi:formate hydrogenlyase subunit 3/multisubunit Na+/H+ antiporter MnhD subunit
VEATVVSHLGPALLVLTPLAAALIVASAGRLGSAGRHGLMVAATGATLATVAAQLPLVLQHGRVTSALPALVGTLRFSLDGVGLLVALVAAFVWVCSTVYATEYLRQAPARTALRYHLTSLLALAAVMGLLAAGDLLTLYVFFEGLGLVGFLFVIHAGGRAAEVAAVKYGVMTLLGGFAVLAGVLLVNSLGGGDLTTPLAVEAGREATRAVAACCLLFGFGVKAGVLGLHVWLPDAHTAAPAPASALLSGIMIKAGAFGIARTAGGLYRAELEAGAVALRQAEVLGLALLWLGVATMLAGVAMALWQHEAKRLLAYSSISQMGFILVGIGAGTYLGEYGVTGWTGSLLHVLNHALFKALLFLAAGAVIVRAGSGDLRALGGLGRAMPWTFAFTLIAAAGIAGVPYLNGFVSKSIIHHALEYALERGGAGGLATAERLFTLTTVGTAAVLVKFVTMTFLGRRRGDALRGVGEAPPRMLATMAALSLAVVALGVRPQGLTTILTRGLEVWQLPAADVGRWLAAPIGHPGDLGAALLALALGALVHAVAARYRVYDRSPPAWLSIDRAYLGVARGAAVGLRALATVRGPWPSGRWARWRGPAAARLAGARVAAAEGAAAGGAAAGRAAALARPPASVPRPLLALPRLARLRLAVGSAWRIASGAGRLLQRHLDESGRLAADDDADAAARRERFDLAARERIGRQSRDVGLNVSLLFLVWLVLLVSLLLARPF